MTNIDFIKNAVDNINNSIESTKAKMLAVRSTYSNWTLLTDSAKKHECVNKCIIIAEPELKKKLPTIDKVINDITESLWDPAIKWYVQKLKNALIEAIKGLTELIDNWKKEDVMIATNYKNQLQNRIDNLKC